MTEPPHGQNEIGLVEPAPGETDVQVLDERREGQLAGRRPESYHGVPPVKPAPWPYAYIPVYFWVGGIAAGSWVAITAEDLAGSRDRAVIRAGRYLSLAGVLTGTALLILDLGRMERFHYMLRVIRPRSPMNLGTWILAGFGSATGAAAILQALEDRASRQRPLLARLSGRRPLPVRLSRGAPGRAIHVVGLPWAVLAGTYTGVLLSATATPSWARSWLSLAPLYFASASSTGIAAISLWVELDDHASEAARVRLARAETAMLAAELALLGLKGIRVRSLASYHDHPVPLRIARGLTLLGGLMVPLMLNARKLLREPKDERPHRARGRPADRLARLLARTPLRVKHAGIRARLAGFRARLADADAATTLLAAGLVLAGGLGLRLVIQHEGTRSAKTPADTWDWAARPRERGISPRTPAGNVP